MSAKLCLLCCKSFYPEIAAAVAAEGWTDVVVAAFSANCGHPPLTWKELQPVLRKDCAEVIIIGRSCLKDLGPAPAGWPPVQLMNNEECFQLVAGATLTKEAIERGAYLMTPGWLQNWRGHLRRMGYGKGEAAAFFHEFARELVLLDTGLVPGAPAMLDELAKEARLPATRLNVGIDYVRLTIGRMLEDWRLKEAHERELSHKHKHAGLWCAMDFLSQLPVLKSERETIKAIREMFQLLFAPEEFHFVRFVDGVPQVDADGSQDGPLPPELIEQMRALKNNWAWNKSKTGFILRIARAGEILGVIAVDRFAFPEYRKQYINLALSVAGVAGLTLDNARTYERMLETEDALRKGERALRTAQAMAKLGHWEVDITTRTLTLSEEACSILGQGAARKLPCCEAFTQALHPDDREQVTSHIDTAMKEGGFDLEFRIVRPNGQIRVIHGKGELVHLGAGTQPKLLGAFQDVTDRKELQWKLEHEARTDVLTGCVNRRHFLELATNELARARRYGSEMSLLMLDLDHFKSVNDRHGHHAGDLVLQTLADICRRTMRSEDVIGRLGGEEFAVLLPETGSRMALNAAERLRRAIARASVPLPDSPPLSFTASIGVATMVPDDFSIVSIITRADQALYEAKNSGRNRAVAA